MNLRRRADPTKPNWEDLLSIWGGIMVAAFGACLCILFGWAFDHATGLIGELKGKK